MSEYLLETKLKAEEPGLHESMKKSIFAVKRVLESFTVRFPTFTDHSILHSMNVLNYCNDIIGSENIDLISARECYLLIMSGYLHDIGMGINSKDYSECVSKIVPQSYFMEHPNADQSNVVRDFHNEFSAYLIEKYAPLFELPEDLVFPIVQLSRGHRKTDLMDEKEYPVIRTIRGTIRLPYLAAVLRLADEIDVASDRNLDILFRNVEIRTEGDYIAFGTHGSIYKVDVEKDKITLKCRPKAPEFSSMIDRLAVKIEGTLDYCRSVTESRSDIKITQSKIVVIKET